MSGFELGSLELMGLVDHLAARINLNTIFIFQKHHHITFKEIEMHLSPPAIMKLDVKSGEMSCGFSTILIG